MDGESVDEEFRKFRAWCEGKSRLYERYCSIILEDEEVRKVVEKIDAPNRPYVLFAAIHDILLKEQGHDLAEFYRSIENEPRDPEIDGLRAAFREFLLKNEDAIGSLAESRKTQTNEVRRTAALIPAFKLIGREVDEPVSMIEIGPSAGLNLFWDSYLYRFDPGGEVGDQDSELEIECEVKQGKPPLEPGLPEVGERRGIDLNPLDVTDEKDVRWLKSLTWPEHVERRERLEKAVEIASRDPPGLVEGDALEMLPEVIESLDDPVLIYATQVLWALPPKKVEEFLELLAELQGEREVYCVFGERGGLDWLKGERKVDDEEPEIWLEWSKDVSRGFEKLGSYEVHGAWLKWVN